MASLLASGAMMRPATIATTRSRSREVLLLEAKPAHGDAHSLHMPMRQRADAVEASVRGRKHSGASGSARPGGGGFSTELFERYQRSEKALVGTLAEMYVQGVSTRKVKAVTEALCSHSFSASSISAINKTLDESLKAFSERRLADPFPYLILDARYERIREGGVITNQAVLVVVA